MIITENEIENQEIQTEFKKNASNKNAFSIELAKGASIETVKQDLKKRGCHYNLLTKVYTCPIIIKNDVEKLLKSKNIEASLHNTFDVYHEKSKHGKTAENIWVKIDILEEQYQKESTQIIIDEELLTNEIEKRELSENDFCVEEKRKDLDKRKKKQRELQEEIDQLRNSVKLRENADKNEIKKVFRCGSYRVDDSGLYYDPIEKKDDEEAIWISSPLWPEAYLRDKEGKSHTILLKVHDGERDHFWAISRRLINKLGDLNDILLDFGLRTPLTTPNQRHLQAFLMQARPDKKMRCVDKSGWHQDQYVFPDGIVIGNSRESEGVFPVNDVCPKGIEQRETLTEWQENVFRLCIGNSRLIFCVGTSLASTCLQLIGEDSGGFNFKGRSSIGKTKCLKAAVSVIGSPDYKRSWKTTANGLEGVCALHNDSLLPLDEFGQSDAKESGEIAYMVDLHPEGVLEKAAHWAGFIKDPKKLSEVFKTGVKLPEIMRAIAPNGKELLKGVGAGAALEAAEQGNFGPIGTMAAAVVGDVAGHGLGTGLSGAKKLVTQPKKTLAQIAAAFTPKDKKQLQQELIKDFRNAGLQADLGTLTDSNLIKWTQSRLAQSGLSGKALDDFRHELTGQIKREYKELAESLGNAKFATSHEAGEVVKEGIRAIRDADLAESRQLYANANKALKESAFVDSNRLAKVITNIEKELKSGAIKSSEQKSVLNALNRLKRDLYDSEGNLLFANVKDLMNNKIALNDIINYEVQGGAKQLLKGIVSELDRAIISHGKENPSFAKNYVNANKKFSEHAKTFRNKDVNLILKTQNPEQILTRMNSVNGIRNLRSVLSKTPEGREIFNNLKRMKLDDVIGNNLVDSTTQQVKLGTFSKLLEKGKNRELVGHPAWT